MSESLGEEPRAVWVDPRYADMLATWSSMRVSRRPGRRPGRVCPHGAGVTVMVDAETMAPRNVQCGKCSPAPD